MTVDSSIAIGDVVLDLAQGSLMQVVEKSYESVEKHWDKEGYDLAEYACHPLFDVQSDEPVWKCVYLKASLKSLPDGSYDFPDSRLARVPVEEANEGLDRVQETNKGNTVEVSREAARVALRELDTLIERTEDDEPDPLTDDVFKARDEFDDAVSGEDEDELPDFEEEVDDD